MSIRLYVGNLPQSFEVKKLDALFATISEGIKFKVVMDRETGTSRGFGFANVDNEKVADALIENLNGHEFGGSNLRIERSERRENRDNSNRRGNVTGNFLARKVVNKIIHSDTPDEGTPDPRWAGELAKLKDLLTSNKNNTV
uniref:Putative RNA-binding protein (RRM domain) n=1 Tax=Paulinella chromatophora TaxID=39717 RepID=B1X484_PAUCH|nr:putative RNA-binding protein (RRM domain) [Paulinella chromatophora]ACB42753.1 putative RNA-binding protein (RRM domain) [Paulinella chromatophora]